MSEDSPPIGRHLLFDCETNGLMPHVDKVHCLGFADIHSGEVFTFTEDTIEEALRQMYDADVLSGHNIIGYDLKVLKKVYNWDPRPGTRLLDTMVIARLKHSDIKKDDFLNPAFKEFKIHPGSHSLKAWGIRLGEHKGDYDGGWEICTPEMIAYMMQDVKTNVRLLQHLKPQDYPRAPLDLEHRVAEVCYQIEAAGWPFDSRKATALYTMLCEKRDVLEAQLIEEFGSWKEVDRVVIPKRPNSALGYTGEYEPEVCIVTGQPLLDKGGKPKQRFIGTPVTHWKTVVFNPGSRVHIEKKLREAGWEPEEFTPTGRALLNDEILETIKLPAAQKLIDYLLIQKRLGQIADGDNGWLKVVQADGRIHGRYNPMGTPHSRASHMSPNIAQVPNEHSLYGPECRDLFMVPDGWRLVGADMAGCQLRVLGHYIGAFDGGAYSLRAADKSRDIHEYHKEASEGLISSRDHAKTTVYAMIFGSGPPRIGKINGTNSRNGALIIQRLRAKIPGFKTLTEAVDTAMIKGWLKGLDGRHVPVRSKHSALNFLIASGEAILCKRWLCDAYDELNEHYKMGWDGDFVVVGWVHDEIQVACRTQEIAEVVGTILVHNAEHAGDDYGFRTKLASASKIGLTWKDTH